MKRFFCNLVLGITALMGALAATGCMRQKTAAVSVMDPILEFVECDQAMAMDLQGVSDDNLYALLNHSWDQGPVDECWEKLMAVALKQGRDVPGSHLANAVHVFNRHETRELFHLAAFAYFTRLVKGEGMYAGAQQQLLARYMSVTISQAQSREDPDLTRAMVVCSRLDPDMYQRFFK
jgi:hypothetical protein